MLDEAFAAVAQAKSNAERNLVNARELFDSVLQKHTGRKKTFGKFGWNKTGKLNANAAVEDGDISILLVQEKYTQ